MHSMKTKKPRARLKNAGLTSNLQFQNDPHDYSPHAARAADTTSHNLIRLNPRTCIANITPKHSIYAYTGADFVNLLYEITLIGAFIHDSIKGNQPKFRWVSGCIFELI